MRAVLASLANPSADNRTAAGIALGLHAEDPTVVSQVGRVLEGLAVLDPKRLIAAWKAPWTTMAGGTAVPVYPLASRRPSGVSGWLQRVMLGVPALAPRID